MAATATTFSPSNLPVRYTRVTFAVVDHMGREVRREAGVVAAFIWSFETCEGVQVDVDGGRILTPVWFATGDVRAE